MKKVMDNKTPKTKWFGSIVLSTYTKAHGISVCCIIIITNRISESGNAITSIRPSVYIHSILWTGWPLTLIFCKWVGSDHGLQGIEGQGYRSMSRSWVRLRLLSRSRAICFRVCYLHLEFWVGHLCKTFVWSDVLTGANHGNPWINLIPSLPSNWLLG